MTDHTKAVILAAALLLAAVAHAADTRRPVYIACERDRAAAAAAARKELKKDRDKTFVIVIKKDLAKLAAKEKLPLLNVYRWHGTEELISIEYIDRCAAPLLSRRQRLPNCGMLASCSKPSSSPSS